MENNEFKWGKLVIRKYKLLEGEDRVEAVAEEPGKDKNMKYSRGTYFPRQIQKSNLALGWMRT
jgi:hypothetical protein